MERLIVKYGERPGGPFPATSAEPGTAEGGNLEDSGMFHHAINSLGGDEVSKPVQGISFWG